MTEATRRMLVTSALPYANGPIHIGHLVEYIQTDIWVRFQKLRGHVCHYVCADDAHGTPIMLRAQAEGIAPEALVDRIGREHRADFSAFAVAFDNYHTTHSDENRYYANLIYTRLRAAGHISRRVIRQAYDPVKQMFLPDRFIRGECPRCGAADQYGDSCEACGATYAPTDLRNPVSVLSGVAPEERDSEHYFFQLRDFEPMLRQWIADGSLQPEVRNKLDEWFDAGLQDWDISRDAPYFGFEIPDAPGKYFYVWLDAPIGYLASFRQLCDREGFDFDEFCGPDASAEMYHFIGKDIVYFHALFWPAMLHGADFRTPTAIFAHGFLTVNGQKMSKSRGTFITARTYLDHLDPEHLRYYFAAKLGAAVEDIDLNLDDFVNRVNADVVGKYVNIASRCAAFVDRQFQGRLGPHVEVPELVEDFRIAGEDVALAFEAREYSRALRIVMALADRANQYIDERKPWLIARDPQRADELLAVVTTGLNLFRLLTLYLKPVLPLTAARVEQFLRIAPLTWEARDRLLLAHQVARFEPLLTRVDPKRVEAMVSASRESTDTAAAPAQPQAPVATTQPDAAAIGLETLDRIDLRVAQVVAADYVDGADKLLRLRVDLGGETRTVFAGIRAAYEPAALVGRMVIVVANLKPRKMRFGLSEGMVLAAGGDDGGIWLLAPDSGARPGMRVR
ncbi:MAG: methionine--tRNA ligase [Gammaproteobacteria bacterium]|nr:methionine--tRNA ligase [Gammaproteobacteria bacterium]